jgi:hypothetical protein
MTRPKKKDLASEFVTELSMLRFENVFNPYAQSCPDHDVRFAASVRRRNLELVLRSALETGVDSFWIARDLGYRGGRRTGLALTDEVHLTWHADLFHTEPLSRATKGPAVAERTATVVWGMLRAINKPIFLWNVFPLHPHEAGDTMSNRCHTRSERAACRPLLMWLLERLAPREIVAIGRDAKSALDELDVCSTAVRHPSYGGQTEFLRDLGKLYSVKTPKLGRSEQLEFL